jgi:hypothetical protein
VTVRCLAVILVSMAHSEVHQKVVRHEAGPVVDLLEVVPQPLEVPAGWEAVHMQPVLADSVPDHSQLVRRVRLLE